MCARRVHHVALSCSCSSFLLPCLLRPMLGFLPTTVHTSSASVPINDLMARLRTSLSLGLHLSSTRTHPTPSKTQVFVCDSMTWRSASRMLQPRVSLQVVSPQISVVVLSYVVLFLLLPVPLLSSVAVISRRMPTGKRKCVLWRSVCYWLS